MEDEKITELLINRDQRGLAELKAGYYRLILKVCRGFLRSPEDAEECANDTLLAVWEKIPFDRPDNLKAYICKIARRRTIDRLRYNNAAMRSAELMTELDECLPSGYSTEDEAEEAELSAALNEWLRSLDGRRQKLFTLRYFYMWSAKDAAKACSMTPTSATTTLARLRASLKQYLTERGLFYE